MSADMTRNLAFTVCTTGGCTATVVQKRGSVSERFNHGLENEYQSQIDSETWGDNNARGDNKVDNKVDNNARGDIKVDNKVDIKIDNNVWDDTVNRYRIDIETIDDTVSDTVKRPQTRTRTTTPYNTRTRPVQHPYKKRRCRLDSVMDRVGGLLWRSGSKKTGGYHLAEGLRGC